MKLKIQWILKFPWLKKSTCGAQQQIHPWTIIYKSLAERMKFTWLTADTCENIYVTKSSGSRCYFALMIYYVKNLR